MDAVHQLLLTNHTKIPYVNVFESKLTMNLMLFSLFSLNAVVKKLKFHLKEKMVKVIIFG